jgi:hypothetical protein
MIRIRPSAPQDAAKNYVRRTAHIESAAGIDDIWFMTPTDTHPLSDDWLLPVSTVIGMALGEDVHIAGRVSERLLVSMEEIQRIGALRNDRLELVGITAEEVASTPGAEHARVVSCFSAGVDAFYTVLELAERIDELLYVHGFEAHVGDERVLARVLPQMRAAAAELRLPLRLAETNWRSVIEPFAGYDYFTGMPMIFAIAHLMGSDVARLVVPGTHDPWSPPEDPSSVATYVGHWGAEGLETIEHGHVSRLEKVRRVSESDIAMRRLRVCWDRRHPIYNCGTCVKCMRTRVHLKLAGAEGRCQTLPPHLSLGEIQRAQPETPVHLNYVDENIAAAESLGMADLATALRVQRSRVADSPTRRRVALAEPERFFRRLHRSYRKRRSDASLRRLKRRHGADHLFNCLSSESPARRT